jgi:hypothetical protein
MGRTVVSRLALCITGVVVFCIVLVHTTSASPDAAQKPTTTSLLEDPLAKFAKLMPVFAHPRCANCRGHRGRAHGRRCVAEGTRQVGRPATGQFIAGAPSPISTRRSAARMH